MRFSAFIFTLAATLAVESIAQSTDSSGTQKINMSCKFAADHTGMVQYPYCCRDMKPARNNAKANEAVDCQLLTVPQLCEDQSRPACCYTIGPKKICTSHVIFQNAEDV
ncbi:Uncharacterized protein PECH_000901 [Penicillium ucsense]|uniref:Hydrophobin n=2 Tax=Penicillium TaxID=5073 RepID=A0A8J8WEY3_9EURO|nr:uncharacterized protein N7539_002855 [Penicillium diatomitis]KAF7713703.1 Uncharacterized protein PECM_000630 [Penicillium ucsense]KAF7733290.1 Uncharacterized protein PECH_000901 [Penicillium ucsense]KAJ5491288.1 hypothetical protein N7539_002855 [Penicillium diatomitis]